MSESGVIRATRAKRDLTRVGVFITQRCQCTEIANRQQEVNMFVSQPRHPAALTSTFFQRLLKTKQRTVQVEQFLFECCIQVIIRSPGRTVVRFCAKPDN